MVTLFTKEHSPLMVQFGQSFTEGLKKQRGPSSLGSQQKPTGLNNSGGQSPRVQETQRSGERSHSKGLNPLAFPIPKNIPKDNAADKIKNLSCFMVTIFFYKSIISILLGRKDSNLQPPESESGAPPIELLPKETKIFHLSFIKDSQSFVEL
jgi:hypothetical protein